SSGSKDATIGGESFKNCTSLQSIVIPGNYTTIYEDAFFGCTSLKSMTLKKSNYTYANQVIEAEVFKGCSALETVSLPTTLKSIGSNAFNGCAIVNLTVPEGVTIIAEGAFTKNTYLKTVSIPSTVTTIGQVNQNFTGAFEGCTKLQTVTISSGSKDATIGGESFKNCTSLQSIVIPGNYTTIYEDAFYGCTSLKSMTLKKSNYTYANQIIDDEAFRGCSALETVSLPTTLKSIGSHAFNGCAIVNLTVPEGVTTIADGAFTNNVNLKTVSLPKTLTSIGATSTGFTGVFENCTNLKSVIFGEGNKDLIIGSETFKKCVNLTTVHLPLNLVEIKEQAFDGSTANLTICSKSNSSYGKTYADNNSIKFKLCNGTHTETPTKTYTVTYNANGGSISPSTVSVKEGESVSLPIPEAKTYTITYNANGGSGAPAAQSFAVACKGWSTSSSATSASYSCGSKYTPTKNVTLYAVWSDKTDGVISTQKPTRSGYNFLGWETSSTATSARFKGGEEVTLTGGNVTLYAVWEKVSSPAVNPTLWCSQTYLRLDTEYTDMGVAKLTINNWGDAEITLSVWASDSSVVSAEFGEFEGSSITLYIYAKKVGDCNITIRLLDGDEKVKYDEKTIRVSVKSDPFEHISLNYKDTYKLNPEGFEIMVADSDSNAVSVDNNGRLNANAEGDAVVTLIDADGNVRYYEVTVSYAWWQWIIIIVLFGWIWY
ncbi:MAG: leucine-rich repeat protein, partial [Acutalibacteraceae bacterium]|nr:leucine-rich repeat protein [Acutalibacteraceae bacterium]